VPRIAGSILPADREKHPTPMRRGWPPCTAVLACSNPTKSREVIYGGRIIGPKIRAEGAREAAEKAVREADRAAAELWSIQMEALWGSAQPSLTIAQCLNGGYGWLQVKCHRCETETSIPLEHVRRPRDTPIWKLESALKCRSCKKGRYAPPVHTIKLTMEREITHYPWVHLDEDDRGELLGHIGPLLGWNHFRDGNL
jgi:hypothetical protein